MPLQLTAKLIEAGINIDDGTLPDSATWQRFVNTLDKVEKDDFGLPLLSPLLCDCIILADSEGTVMQILAHGTSEAVQQSMIIGRTLDALFGCELETCKDLIEQAISDNTPQVTNLNCIDKNLEIRATKAHDQALVLIKDLTEVVQSDIRNRLSTTMFNATDQGLAILDTSFNVISINHALTKILGVDEENIVGRPPYFLDSVQDRLQSETIWASLSAGKNWKGEFNARRKDGALTPLWLTIDSVLNEEGQINNHLILLSDISEEKKSQNQLQFIATHDPLTGLPNRICFFEHLEKIVNRCNLTNKTSALLSFDIDRFKNINESLGHQLGDELLIIIADRLNEATREKDFLARLGGDEFAMIAEDVETETIAAIIAEKVLQVFSKPIPLGNYNIEVTASVGITLFPKTGVDSGQLLRQADTAMYNAKEQGRNSYEFFSEDLAARKTEFFELEMGLRQAQAQGELYVLYQPQYDLKTHKMVGAEALARWNHPILGPISPSRFIPVAEISGFIDNLGDWVLEQALQDFGTWHKPEDESFLLSVNLSRRQLINPKLILRLDELFTSYDIKPSAIEFEITERAIVHINETATANINALRKMGCNIAMDDFGTGDSSLLNLKRFPFNRIKIDQSFVSDVTKDANDEAIIKAVIALANSLQITVIAEGVETIAQSDFLTEEGCDQAQGFLYSKPISSEACATLLQSAAAEV